MSIINAQIYCIKLIFACCNFLVGTVTCLVWHQRCCFWHIKVYQWTSISFFLLVSFYKPAVKYDSCKYDLFFLFPLYLHHFPFSYKLPAWGDDDRHISSCQWWLYWNHFLCVFMQSNVLIDISSNCTYLLHCTYNRY